MVKILDLVASCGKCPNYGYYSGGVHECRMTNQIVHRPGEIAPFCPLPDFPSAVIAGLDMTIKRLMEPYSLTLPCALLSHVSAKLGLAFDSRGSTVMIPLEGGEQIPVTFDSIVEVKMGFGAEIHFLGNNREKYVLYPDATPPALRQELDTTGPNGEALFRDLRLKACLPPG